MSLPVPGRRTVYVVPVRAADSPIFATMITELGAERAEAVGRAAAAEARADELADALSALEALHEPNADGECPACGAPSPCLTMLLLRRDITVEQAFGALRDGQVVDLVSAERPARPVPSLSELLAAPTRGMDRFFDALLGLPEPGGRDRRAS